MKKRLQNCVRMPTNNYGKNDATKNLQWMLMFLSESLMRNRVFTESQNTS